MGYLNPGWINDLIKIKPLAANNLIPGLLAESHTYLTLAAPCQGFNTANIQEYTKELLKWWKVNHPTIPTWAKAARIIFALTPSSAASERVFSLVDSMFGSDRKASLADQLQGSVMLKYNKRAIG